MHYDSVLIGSLVTIAIAAIIVVFLAWKVGQLMKRDAQSHEGGRK